MALVLTTDERNALRDQIFDRLPGIDDVWLSAKTGDFEAAHRLAREYADDLQLLNECLGWDENPDSEQFPLDLPADLLKRVFTRHGQLALMRDTEEEKERSDLRDNREANVFLIETCKRALAKVDPPCGALRYGAAR